MKKKKLSAASAAVLSMGLLFSAGLQVNAQEVKASTSPSSALTAGSSAPIDFGIANDEKLIEMLKKSGKIPANATDAESQKLLNKYLKKLAAEAPKDNGSLKAESAKLKKQIKNKQNKNGVGKDKRFEHADKVKSVKKDGKWKGPVREDKVLVLLAEYPDFPHNSIKPGESDMYYKDYTEEHYQDMIFGEKGYEGPSGQKLMSVKQFYEEQSGGSYTISGHVSGWYKAPHNAAYYGGNDPATGSDANPRSLIKDILNEASKDPNLNLQDYDKEDRYDLDGDGNYHEPDGLIDHLMVVHSSVGEEAGGGSLGADAIWSHRWNLGSVYSIPGTTADSDNWNGKMAAYDYTVEPADGAAGVFAHEYGHDLGLPDEYDTQYTGAGEAVGHWSIMSSGSWSGDIPGTEPTGFSSYDREYLQNSMEGSNWLKGSTLDFSDITKKGTSILLDQANSKGSNNDAVRVNLPDKKVTVNTPASGNNEFFSGKGDNLHNSMKANVDLTNASSAQLTFKTWYDIEKNFDYASVRVSEDGGKTFTGLANNLTTDTNPNESNPGNGITGTSNGWVDAAFDLSAYAGKNIILSFNYDTDGGAAQEGFYADDIKVTTDKGTVLEDNADSTIKFDLSGGFQKSSGYSFYTNYYLLEWRNHQGADAGLAHIRRGDSLLSYDPGLIVWYVDNSFTDNWTGIHPGEGFLGVVDADQNGLKWSDGTAAANRYQLHDAAFGLVPTSKFFLNNKGITLTDSYTRPNPLFSDSFNYTNPVLPDSGRKVPNYGLKFIVTGESSDRTVGQVVISK
ncbi:immune inhibitor A domain-containing protein [Peribacillus kribbensis]|uniref:immune inhibitor A domain-containing protein n=1 Tax=Peribacillus kribbensis TaxID=356658 RepID=UPI00040D62B0|nr:immune inhibitor A domain-containing protein [Peribacillus kribbensis]